MFSFCKHSIKLRTFSDKETTNFKFQLKMLFFKINGGGSAKQVTIFIIFGGIG